MRRGLLFFFTLLLMGILVFGCGLQGSNDEQDINDLMGGDYYGFFSPFSEIDDGGVVDDGGVLTNETAYVYPWGRLVELPVDRDIWIHVVGDIADVTVADQISGKFLVDTNFDAVPGEKPMEHTGTVYGEFTYDPEHDSPFSNQNGWYLSAISIYELRLTQEEEQTVEIESVRVYTSDYSFDMTYTDPTALYDPETEVPHFPAGSVVYVEATVSNSTTSGYDPPTFVYLHWPNSRAIFTDTGDHIHFIGSWVPMTPGVHHAGVDVLDSKCIQNETEDDYNATIWCLPYIVE